MDRLSYSLCDKPGSGHDRRRAGNLEVELQTLRSRQKYLDGVMASSPRESDAWDKAAEEYDNLSDAIAPIERELETLYHGDWAR